MRYIDIKIGENKINEIYDQNIIRQGENNASQMRVSLSEDFLGYKYRMLLQMNLETPIVTPELVPVDGVLTFMLTNALTNTVGKLKVEIQAFDDDGSIMKSAIVLLQIKATLDGTTTAVMPESYVPWYVLAVEESSKATAQAVISTQKAVESATSSANALASENNAKTSETNAKTSETNAKTSEVNAKTSETNSKASETVTTQAMTDYLAMIGVNIATLDANGKLTPSQIPSISINSTFTVTNVSQIVGLNAQEGDVAIVVPIDVVTDTYMLAGSDPTVLSNWKKLGVSYVSESGHSITSDSATDSQMINGHRIVTMTQAQYDVAVKDAETIYIVN